MKDLIEHERVESHFSKEELEEIERLYGTNRLLHKFLLVCIGVSMESTIENLTGISCTNVTDLNEEIERILDEELS
jgi:hypothetical protein